MESIKPEERNDYEILDGKKIPMRYWNPRLSSKDICLIDLCLTRIIIDYPYKADENMKNEMRELFEKLRFSKMIPE